MGDSGDRRASERMPVTAGTTCSFAGQVAEELAGARVRDVSLEGLGLVLIRKVDIGTLLAVNLANPTKNFVKTVIIRVAHVTSVPGGYLVGGAFTAPLTIEELTTIVM